MKKYILPCILISCDLGAAFMYAADGDVWKTIYWTALAAITCAVAF